jgi:hypothetical protein
VTFFNVTTSRVYISCDVVFDENIFSFASIHPNVGLRLREKIMLLPENTSSSASNDRGVHTNDQYMHIAPIFDPMQVVAEESSSHSSPSSGQNYAESSSNSTSNDETNEARETEPRTRQH